MALKDGEVLRELPLGDKTREGIFVGYHCHPGGKWSGDYLVIDAQDMRHADSIRSYHARRIKDIVAPDYVTFPVRAGTIKEPSRPDQDHSLEEAYGGRSTLSGVHAAIY